MTTKEKVLLSLSISLSIVSFIMMIFNIPLLTAFMCFITAIISFFGRKPFVGWAHYTYILWVFNGLVWVAHFFIDKANHLL